MLVWLPTDKAPVVSDAVPPTLSATVPRLIAPSMKLMLPVGAPRLPATDALNETSCPKMEGLGPLLAIEIDGAALQPDALNVYVGFVPGSSSVTTTSNEAPAATVIEKVWGPPVRPLARGW